MSRASTLLLALLILNALLAGLCLAVARGERKSQALRLWAWGLLVYSIGLLITLPSALPFDFRKILGNGLIAFSPILTVEGAVAYTSYRLNRRWITAAYILTVLPIIVNHSGGHFSVLVDLLSPAPLANILFLVAAVALMRFAPRDARHASRFVAAIFVFDVVVWCLRMWAVTSSIGISNDRERADLVIALFSIAQIVAAVASTLGLLWIEVRLMQAELARLANSDALTGLPNRRATMARFAEELSRAERRGRPVSLVVFDVDHFKRINDIYGHLAGDAALRHIASILDTSRREVDLAGRVGGEEFTVILGEEGAEEAFVAANRMREAIAATPFEYQALKIPLSISGGISTYPADGTEWDRLFAAADDRLYAAKEGGRNRVIGPRPTTVSAASA